MTQLQPAVHHTPVQHNLPLTPSQVLRASTTLAYSRPVRRRQQHQSPHKHRKFCHALQVPSVQLQDATTSSELISVQHPDTRKERNRGAALDEWMHDAQSVVQPRHDATANTAH
jgi:hypothetical protein